MKKVITTVGTSLFSNYRENTKEVFGELNRKYIENKPFSENDERKNTKIKEILQNWFDSGENLNGISAEIKSLTKLQKEQKEDLEVYLITTDTVASNLAAEILKIYFEKYEKIKIQLISKIDDLQIWNFNKFEKGKDNLIKTISKFMKEFSRDLKGNKVKKYYRNNVIFNVTGGYKGIIPIMTILAQLYECQIYYIFEKSDNMISIPRIPINFDPILTEALFVELWLKKDDINYSIRNKEKLLEYGFIDKNNNITSLGKLFYDLSYYHQATSQNVFGYFVEYKIFEYLFLNGRNGFSHSLKIKGQDGKSRELDFVFENNDTWEVWEVKSANRFLNINNLDELMQQFKNQIENYPKISEYKIVVYSITDKTFNQIEITINKIIANIKSDYQKISFSADFLLLGGLSSIKKQESEVNPYQKMFKDTIKETDFTEIKLEEK